MLVSLLILLTKQLTEATLKKKKKRRICVCSQSIIMVKEKKRAQWQEGDTRAPLDQKSERDLKMPLDPSYNPFASHDLSPLLLLSPHVQKVSQPLQTVLTPGWQLVKHLSVSLTFLMQTNAPCTP